MKWEVGQTVEVQSRTWAGINKPGGCAKIIKVHMTADGNYIEGLDIKYVLSGGRELKIDPAIVSPFETLERGGRKRRSRDFLLKREEDVGTENENPEGRKTGGKGKIKSNKKRAEPALKESHSSRQSSATFSTPRKQAKKPMKVTPIPKMVITGREIDYVSPMTEDALMISGHTDKKNTSVARRLYDELETRQKAKMKSKFFPPLPPKNEPRSQAKQQLKQDKNNDSCLINEKPPAEKSNPINKLATAPINCDQTSQRKSNKSKIATKPIGIQLKGGNSSFAFATKTAPRHKSASSSFSRVESIYDKNKPFSSRVIPEPNRKPLIDVYRREKEKAMEFMDEMVGNGNDHNLGESASSGLDENARFICTSSRYGEFLSNIYKVWLILDEEEVSDQRFREVFNEVTSNSFAEHELDGHIQSLCDEGKVMRSEGMLYRIH